MGFNWPETKASAAFVAAINTPLIMLEMCLNFPGSKRGIGSEIASDFYFTDSQAAKSASYRPNAPCLRCDNLFLGLFLSFLSSIIISLVS